MHVTFSDINDLIVDGEIRQTDYQKKAGKCSSSLTIFIESGQYIFWISNRQKRSPRFAKNTISRLRISVMQIDKATPGQSKLYERLKGGKVTAVNGKSSAVQGWRPVCKGIYLGNECKPTESGAIKAGEKYLTELAVRVTAMQKSGRPKIKKGRAHAQAEN